MTTFLKVITLMVVEDAMWFSLGRYTGLPVWAGAVICILIAIVFTRWIRSNQ